MNAHSIALFLHIAGALGYFAMLALEWASLRQIRSATRPEQARAGMGMLRSTNKLGFPCMLTIVVTGTYMMLTEVGWAAWILVTIGALVLVIALFVSVSAPRLKSLARTLGPQNEAMSPQFANLANDPLLWISVQTRLAIILGIVLLKTTTPGWGGSLLIIGMAVVLGIASALPMVRRERAQRASAD